MTTTDKPKTAPTLAPDAPTLAGYRGGNQWAVPCDECLRFHTHKPHPGHRRAHCTYADSLYAATGYNVTYAGPFTEQIVREHRAKWDAMRRERHRQAQANAPRLKHPPREEERRAVWGYYLHKPGSVYGHKARMVAELVKRRKARPREGLNEIVTLHFESCGIFRGRSCDCEPEPEDIVFLRDGESAEKAVARWLRNHERRKTKARRSAK